MSNKFAIAVRTIILTGVFLLMAAVPHTGATDEACAAETDPCETIRQAALEACLDALGAILDAMTGEGSVEDAEAASDMCQDQYDVWEEHCAN